jgi:major capsid protein
MSTCTFQANSTSAASTFIDLATFSELESFTYGGPHAISLFVAGVQKANWFSMVPIVLRNIGSFDFGCSAVSSSLNRSGDYVLNVWFRCEIPSVAWSATFAPTPAATDLVRWTRNLMHNLIRRTYITFNELTVEEFESFWMDAVYMFTIPASKRVGYKNMIGDIPSLISFLPGTATSATLDTNGAIQGGFFSVPLRYWFDADSGIALPIAALPFNDVKINYEFRNLADLLVFNTTTPGVDTVSALTFLWLQYSATTGETTFTINNTGMFRNACTHAHYAVVHNDERVKMGDAPRDQLIRQVQTICGPCIVNTCAEHYFDIRLSHSIITFFFALKNVTVHGEHSNYTTNYNYYGSTANFNGIFPYAFAPTIAVQGIPGSSNWYDPIEAMSLIYENTIRLADRVDFYALTHPYYFSDTVPDEIGYHMWSYALKPWDPLGPSGSTNYSKLANVQVRLLLSARAQFYLNNALPATEIVDDEVTPITQQSSLKLQSLFTAINWNVGRIANGSFGHPTL